jgi:hypothetical protein
MKKIIIVFLAAVVHINISLAVDGTITEIRNSWNNELKGQPVRGEIYRIVFTGHNIKDLHILLVDPSTTVSYNTTMPTTPSGSDIDVSTGSFTGGATWTCPNTNCGKKWMSFYGTKSGSAITSGEIQIRVNKGTPGFTVEVYFSDDGDADLITGNKSQADQNGKKGITLSSVVSSDIPTLSEWSLIILGFSLLLGGARYIMQRKRLKISF